MKKRNGLLTFLLLMASFFAGALSVFLLDKRKALINARRAHLEQTRHSPSDTFQQTEKDHTTGHPHQPVSIHQESLPQSRYTIPWDTLVVIFALFFAGVGPVLVILDRWLNQDWFREILRNTWCRSDILCRTIFPSYFIFILPATFIALLLLIFLVKKENTLSVKQPKWSDEMPVTHEKKWHGILPLDVSIFCLFLAETILAATNIRKPGPEYIFLILILVGYRFIYEWKSLKPVLLKAKSQMTWLLPFSLIFIALVFLMEFLAGQFSYFVFIPISILILGTIWLYPNRRKVPVILWVSLAMIPLYSLLINSWRFSVMGDEYVFFDYGKMILENQPVRMIFLNLLNPHTVIYGKFTFLSVLPNILSMAIFGTNNFGWRIVNPIMCSASLPFFYYFFKRYIGTRNAIVFGMLTAGSYLLLTFSKVGYNNLQGLLVMGILLWITQLAINQKSLFFFLLLGLSLGIGMYMYPTTFAIIPLPVLLLFLYNNPFWIYKEIPQEEYQSIRRMRLKQWITVLLGFILVFMPILFEPNYWEAKTTESIFASHAVTDYSFHFVTNVLYTVFSPIYAPEESHFVVSSFLDPISGIFLISGLAWGIKYIFKSKFAFFMVAGFAIQILILGPTRDHGWTSVTHMFQFIPWLCALVAIGICWVLELIPSKTNQTTSKNTSVVRVLLILIIFTNLYMSFSLSPRHSDRYYMVEALSFRFFERSAKMGVDTEAQYLYLTSPGWDIHGIRSIQEVYGFPSSADQLMRSPVYLTDDPARMEMNETQWAQILADYPNLRMSDGTPLPDISLEKWAMDLLLEPDVIFAVDSLLPSDQYDAIQQLMRQSGRKICVLRAAITSDPRITLWLSPEWEPLCPVNGIWEEYW